MNLIKRIEIKHFRSIHEIVIDGLSDINVFSGLNDVGKSNVIKALNLFFNDQVDWQTNLDFDQDLNSWHAHMAPHRHDKKNIIVRVEFRRPKSRYKSVKSDTFWIQREWDNDNTSQPLSSSWGKGWNSKAEPNWNKGLTFFLKQCEFHYVPAVRDRSYLQHLLAEYSKAIAESPDLELAAESERLTEMIASRSSNLRSRLKEITGIDVRLELPGNLQALLEASGLNTIGDIPLQLRGDGIQNLSVVGLLEELTSISSKEFNFWGFEEPENSLEYIKAAELADDIRDRYSAHVQVFLTTHSPAFVAMKEKASVYRIRTEDRVCTRDHEVAFESVTSSIQQVYGKSLFDDVNELSEDLGFLEVMRRIDDDFRDYEAMKKENEELNEIVENLDRPILIVEGKNDCLTLRHAWERFRQIEMPFDIVVAGAAHRVKSLLADSVTNSTQIFALFDHDQTGVKEIKLLSDFEFMQSHDDVYLEYRYRNRIVAQTLLAPSGREQNAENENLSMEHYFSDTTLLETDRISGGALFSKTNYIRDRQNYRMDEETLKKQITNGDISLVHRRLENKKGKKKAGKSYLVDRLPCLPDEEFEAFNDLFKAVVRHLVPESELTPIVATPETQTEI